jgi:hypothetical protein
MTLSPTTLKDGKPYLWLGVLAANLPFVSRAVYTDEQQYLHVRASICFGRPSRFPSIHQKSASSDRRKSWRTCPQHLQPRPIVDGRRKRGRILPDFSPVLPVGTAEFPFLRFQKTSQDGASRKVSLGIFQKLRPRRKGPRCGRRSPAGRRGRSSPVPSTARDGWRGARPRRRRQMAGYAAPRYSDPEESRS